jgi:thymidylate kinase
VSYQSIVIEGADQVGKADTTRDLGEYLLSENIPIYRFSFPQYATPFGSAIRLFLKNGVEDIQELGQIKGTRREIEIRMMMFALDRLQALESILRMPEDKDRILLLDRGPYSNALTIAYGISVVENLSDEDVHEMANLGFDMEEYLIKTLNLDNCVIQLSANHGKEGWKSIRNGGEDQYEKREVQEKTEKGYLEFSKVVGEGWKTVITKEKGDWKDRSLRNKEVTTFIEERIDLSKTEKEKSTSFESIDVLDIAKDMYGLEISKEAVVQDFYRALDENDKSTIYQKGLDIGESIALECKNITIKDKGVKNSILNILEAYPECILLLEYYYGETFVKKLIKAIND